jgi:3-carboxy-cis,cis-muconate cycloisomerase
MSDTAGLFDGVLAAGDVRDLTGDTAWLRAMLDFEAALAAAEAEHGLVDPADAAAVADAAADPSSYDAAALGRAAAGIGNPAGPLVRALTERAGAAGRSVHLGATSQDVVDTAAMLVAHRALGALLTDLRACGDLLADLAQRHTGTVQVGRTLLQHALPTTFGVVAASWLSGVDAAADRLAAVREERLAVQFGGAVGTLASLGERGPAVLTSLAARLGLREAAPWHTERTRVAELAAALGGACGAVATVARDVVLLAQTEVAEVREEGPAGTGGSSTMPHKRNPVAAVAAAASAQQAPGLVGTLFAAMAQEHQRAAGSWHAEWLPLRSLLRATGSAAHWLRVSLERLRVDEERMRANVGLTGGLSLAERVTTALAPSTGRLAAHDAVAACCRRAADGEGDLAGLLAADPLVGAHLDRSAVAALLDPAGHLGSAGEFTARAVAAHRGRTS